MFLSGHGSMDKVKYYTLPFELVTFCPMGDYLDIPTSWKVFDALCTSNQTELSGYIHKRYAKGTKVDRLILYPTTDFTSGVFKVGEKTATRYLDSGQFTIEDFGRFYRDVERVYWVACLGN
jgi:hypothetical protein